MSVLLRTVCAVALLLVVAGCDSKTTVSGTVTYNGEPVENSYISFSPAGEQGRSFAAPIVNGEYEVKEAFPGKVTAVATGTRLIDNYSSSADAYANAGGGRAHTAADADYIAVDAEGNSQQVEIESGSQVLNFDITGPPAPK